MKVLNPVQKMTLEFPFTLNFKFLLKVALRRKSLVCLHPGYPFIIPILANKPLANFESSIKNCTGSRSRRKEDPGRIKDIQQTVISVVVPSRSKQTSVPFMTLLPEFLLLGIQRDNPLPGECISRECRLEDTRNPTTGVITKRVIIVTLPIYRAPFGPTG